MPLHTDTGARHAMNGAHVALPKNQLVVPVISSTVSLASRRSIAAISDCSNAAS
jgi:hypothetical protein